MRAALNAVYRTSGVLAGIFLVAIGAMSLIQITGRLLGLAASSYDEYAGYCMAASSFLGMAWTLRSNEQIRMTLVLAMTRGRLHRGLEILCLGLATFIVGYFAWYSIDMVVTSYRLEDVSQGLVPIKLWIPQSGMALGLVVLALAFVDDLAMALTGRQTSYQTAEMQKKDDSPVFER